MRAPISVIIPTLNAGASLHATLMSLMEGVEAGLIRELIVSDGGSEDDTLNIARAWGAEIVSGAPSRGGQLRRGCEIAKGDWFLILHADTHLEPGWLGPTARHMRGEGAAWFKLQFEGGGLAGRLVACWANWRSKRGLPYGDQGLFISADLYGAVGGYPEIPLMEDVALARALKGQLVPLDAVAITCSEKYRRQGWMRRGVRNLWTLLRYFVGTDPKALAADYRR